MTQAVSDATLDQMIRKYELLVVEAIQQSAFIAEQLHRDELEALRELKAKRQAVREAREYARHAATCHLGGKVVVNGVLQQKLGCTCGLDAWLAAHPAEKDADPKAGVGE